MADSSWIDSVPGARPAYDWLAAHVDTFFAIGPALERQIALLDALWAQLPPPPRSAAQLAALNAWVTLRNEIVADLDQWARLEPSVRWLWSAVQSITRTGQLPATTPATLPGLGFTPAMLLTLARYAAWMIGAQIALKQILDRLPQREQAVENMVAQQVAAGNMTVQEGADVVRQGKPSVTTEVFTLLKWGAIAGAGVLVLQLLIPPPSRRRR